MEIIKRALQRFRGNLSLKLIALFMAGGLALAMLIGTVAEYGLERRFVDQVQPHFRHYFKHMVREIGDPPNIQRAQAMSEERDLVIRIFSKQQNWASDGNLSKPRRIRRHDHDFDEGLKERRKKRGEKRHDQSPRARFFFSDGLMFVRIAQPQHEVFFGFKVRDGKVPWLPIAVGLLVLLGLYGFYRLTRWLFAPVGKIGQGVRLIGEGQVGHQITVNRKDELGQLAADVNVMSADLARMLKAKRDMLLALSHELKSPLARARVNLALMEPSNLQQNLLRDQEQIERLIDEVLESERVHADHALLHRAPTNLAALVDTVIDEDLQQAALEVKHQGKLQNLMLDKNQIRRLLRNLLENALRYNRPEHGPVYLELDNQKAQLLITVKDNGEGVEPEQIGRLTEAFYRVDPARATNTGGLGLGLYLCKNIAQAHSGQLDISSELGVGTQVVVSLPHFKD